MSAKSRRKGYKPPPGVLRLARPPRPEKPKPEESDEPDRPPVPVPTPPFEDAVRS